MAKSSVDGPRHETRGMELPFLAHKNDFESSYVAGRREVGPGPPTLALSGQGACARGALNSFLQRCM